MQNHHIAAKITPHEQNDRGELSRFEQKNLNLAWIDYKNSFDSVPQIDSKISEYFRYAQL